MPPARGDNESALDIFAKSVSGSPTPRTASTARDGWPCAVRLPKTHAKPLFRESWLYLFVLDGGRAWGHVSIAF